MKKVDYLIIGQGLAGTMMAHFALKAGKSILVIDQSKPNTASKVSAGLINPITGRQFVKSWRMDDLLPFATQTYQEISEQLGVTFFNQKNIIRAFPTTKAENNWFVRSSVPSYFQYVKDEPKLEIYGDIVNPALGYGEITGGGRVEVNQLLATYRAFLKEKNYLLEEEFVYSDIQLSDNALIKYQSCEANKIVFSEGIGVLDNPYFNYLPIRGNKGEILIIKIPDIAPKKILKQSVFLVPIGDQRFWVGSTYFNQYEDENPSERGRENLIGRLEKAIHVPYEIIEHRAAIRPTVPDRRPLIGRHPQFANLILFNGMGTKAASLSPYWAHHLVDCLEEGKEIDKEASLARYKEW